MVDESTASSGAKAPDPVFVSQVDDALTELGRRADRYSIVIAFRSELSSLAALHRALQAADCPWFGVDLDPVSILRDQWSLDEVFSALGLMIRHVRARDAIAGSDNRSRPATVGQGGTDWSHLLSNLDAASYRAWITVDPTELPNRAAGAEAAIKILRSELSS
jgi:sugar phosphate isomerase/epimerase